ncbi:MAG: RNase adapter RapZ [Actinobacteria bacterium]|nr:RNase adapter RapZ [Actinomycetota bacterium]MBU1494408.1 RNase adapter RapZ [Actinomycetota bacterium]
MSGAGRSTASNALEDLGFFVIDNLPAGLIGEAVEWDDNRHDLLAFVVDTRGGLNFESLEGALDELAATGVPVRVLFLDAADDILVKRFQESRRPHPVDMPTLSSSIAAERAALDGLRDRADLVLDTGGRSVHDLRSTVQGAFGDRQMVRPMRVSVLSFGFKHGVPQEADMVLDARFLPNPHWVPALRDLTGLDGPVADYVAGQPDTPAFVDRVCDMLDFLLPRYEAEGKAYFTVAVGCTGGHHRSVAIAEQLGAWLRERAVPVSVTHRDIER